MENSEVLVTMCKPMCDKVNILKSNVEFLKCIKNNNSDSIKIIEKIDSTVAFMLNDMHELQQLLEEQRVLYNETKVEEIEISHLLYKTNVLHKERNGNLDFEDSDLMNGSASSEQVAPHVDFSPIQLNNAPSSLCRENLRPQSIAFDIAYLTEEDFKLIPKYMVGRLTLEAINNFIDVINDAFSKKYNILSKHKSTLKNQELNLFRKYKHQQNVELKGKHFIIEEDIAREFNKTGLEKKAYSFLTILRHTKRLLRSQIRGVTVFIANTPEWSNIQHFCN